MIIGCVSVVFILLLQILVFHPPPVKPFPSDSNASSILQDVLKVISAKQKWDFDGVRVSKFDVGKVRFSASIKYEFRIGLGRNHLLLRSSDQVGSWNKFRKSKSDLGSLIRQVSSLAVLDTFKLEGPFELGVDGHHQLTLSLPMNISYSGLKHILVGEGITLEVKGAQEVSLFHSSDIDQQTNGSAVFSKGKIGFGPFMQSMCMPLIPIRILGSASLVAYRARNPDVYIENTYISGDTIELLPEKCYRGLVHRKRACPINSFSLRLSMLEKIFRSLLGRRILQNQVSRLVKANVKASSNVRFSIELERVVGSNITVNGTLPKWRTRPSVERDWFQVWARVEGDRLKPLMVKKSKPFIESDSVSWGNLMSNMSFTKLRSVLVPPEALTLDVKWF
ncbi:protein TUNICAMYCIN INDUCED 1-like isoform X2 [Prosopis cineraria]|uniref:protein TUNICAMYCIN INDUCED 1-like isoform X2 n=1 Tax=Prosopis cineraria TaxID=364024 RepID=UPI002410992B|nr:protein TUNICAMYCIN INDUCED 1-like isoform X2 [Prosopis cineraria]